MHKFKTNMIPKWTGSIHSAVTTGKKMGVKIKTDGVISINIQTINKIKLIISRIIILLSLNPSKKELISWGIFSKERTQDMHIEALINNITIAVVSTDFRKILGSFLSIILYK